eukprot:1186849-Prorocentrum_minimum.AAC.2
MQTSQSRSQSMSSTIDAWVPVTPSSNNARAVVELKLRRPAQPGRAIIIPFGSFESARGVMNTGDPRQLPIPPILPPAPAARTAHDPPPSCPHTVMTRMCGHGAAGVGVCAHVRARGCGCGDVCVLMKPRYGWM